MLFRSVATELYMRNLLFDFATNYYWNHPGISSPDQFVFTDQDYTDFRNFVTARDFNYRTTTEESISQLINNAKREKYYEVHQDLFNKLEKEVSHNLEQDLAIFRDEITKLLEEEIIGRYFYEEGTIAWSIKEDEQVKKALETLNNREKYISILSGKIVPELTAGSKN